MLILTKSILALMIGFTLSAIIGLILVPTLKKLKARQNVSSFLAKAHNKKNGVPTMGGLIFITSTLLTFLILIITGKLNFSYNLLIVVFVFLSYGLLGFVDDFLSIKKGHNEGLTTIQKLIAQILIAIVFYIIYIKTGGNNIVSFYTLNITINLGWFYPFFILFVLVGFSNATNITDGLDGLSGGLSVIAFLTFGLITWGSTWVLGYQEIAIMCFVLVGSLMGFLLYNTHPARIIMGDIGSLSLGATLATIGILTHHELTLIVVSGVFVVETLTVIIQNVSMMLTGKKVFLMTPLHHHFEKIGWQEQDIVKLFWTIGLFLGMLGVGFGVWI